MTTLLKMLMISMCTSKKGQFEVSIWRLSWQIDDISSRAIDPMWLYLNCTHSANTSLGISIHRLHLPTTLGNYL